MDRRVMTWMTVIAGTVLVVLVIFFWNTLFGPGTWGAGGNMVAWVLCGGLSFLWLNVIQRERHWLALKQADRHHREKMDQADRHHREQLELAREHHADMKRHVAVTAGQGQE